MIGSMNNQNILPVKEFREELYQTFKARAAASMNLLDALTSNTTAKTVVELSLSQFFPRGYGSLYDAINSYTQANEPDKEWQAQEQAEMRLIAGYLPKPKQRKFWLLAQDATACPRPYAYTLSEKGYVYQPSLIRGNKPVTIGHQYSALVVLPEKITAQSPPWVVPLVLRRIPIEQTELLVGAKILNRVLSDPDLPFHAELTVDVVDSKYGVATFLGKVAHNDNAVIVARSRSNRVYYRPYVSPEVLPGQPKPKGHPAWYGERFVLKESDTWGTPDQTLRTTYTSKRGRAYTVIIQSWEGLLMRGKRDLPMHDKPFTLLRIRMLNAEGKPAFKRDLWLIVMGKRRHDLSLLNIWQAYRQRFDIEHFFRFGKQRLLLDKFQTPESEREESWIQFVKLAYVQLWLMSNLVNNLPRPWEKYLPQVKDGLVSPSQTLRDAERIIRQIGTPAQAPKPRGKSPGRLVGTKMPRRKHLPVIKKNQKLPAVA